MARASRSATALAVLWGLMAGATSSYGEEASPPAASLTVVSRPSGALCRVRGDRMVVGATPLTLPGVQPGNYSIRAIDPAYERWQRTVKVDGVQSDTVWMSLRERTSGRATLRSLCLPGWGQFYSSRPGWGWIYASSAVGLFGGSIAAQSRYVDLGDEVSRARTLEEWERAVHKMNDARRLRNALQGSLAAVWGISLLDAALRHPRRAASRASLEIVPSGGPELARLSARIRF